MEPKPEDDGSKFAPRASRVPGQTTMTPQERNSEDSSLDSKDTDSPIVQPRPGFVRGSRLYDPAYGELIDWDWAEMQPVNGGER